MRKFSFITIGQIIEELAEIGLYLDRRTIKRHKTAGLFKMGKTIGGWHRTNRIGAEKIKKLLWMNYLGEEAPYPKWPLKKRLKKDE